MTTVLLCSGGLDSVVLAHLLAADEPELRLFAVNYGQRHQRELGAALACAERLGAAYTAFDLRAGAVLFGATPLTDVRVPVPDGPAADPVQHDTVVPNRNVLLLALAYAHAAERRAERVAIACTADDAAVYADCRLAFLSAFAAMERFALAGVAEITLLAPFVKLSKAEVVRRGADLGVPFAETYSCYRGDRLHCGTCGACSGRRAAFAAASVADPTCYRAVAVR